MDPQAIRDLQRRLEVLERTTVRYRQGVVADPSPLDVTIGDVTVEAVPGLAATQPVTDGGNVALLTFGNALIALGEVGDPPEWTSYTPAVSNTSVTLGTGGQIAGAFHKVGRTVHARGRVDLGTGGGFTGSDVRVSLPFTAGSTGTIGASLAFDSSAVAFHQGVLRLAAGANVAYFNLGASSVALSASGPFAWADGDALLWAITYEAAS